MIHTKEPSRLPAARPTLRSELLEWGAGFLGAGFLVALAPRAARFLMRHVVGRLAAEIVSFFAFGLVFERLTDWIGRRDRG